MTFSGERTAVVLGGGVAGLTAARALQEQGEPCLLLERCPTPGGLTRTVAAGEFCFDYTGHFLHLSRFATPADIPYAGLKTEDWMQVDRRSCCLVGGKLVNAPIQYNLGELPPALLEECRESYNQRPRFSGDGPLNFRDYIVSGFGERLADLFLIPQNEKTMATSLERLSSSAVRRFFPAPDENLVRAGMSLHGRGTALGYNANFWYPKVGGISRLIEGLHNGVERCLVNQEVTALDLPSRTLTTSNGKRFAWNLLFSSMPLNELCRISGDEELQAASRTLSHSSTVSINIGLRGALPTELENLHWVYVPDRDVPFYRVGFYSNISRGTCTDGYTSVYAEVGLSTQEASQQDLIGGLQPEVLHWLEKLGWIQRKNVVCVVTHLIRHAYVHHTADRDRTVRSIVARLHEHDIFPIGRYGLWDYTSMEDSIESARTAVQEVRVHAI
jgi:protoporphyrinogen oxidase